MLPRLEEGRQWVKNDNVYVQEFQTPPSLLSNGTGFLNSTFHRACGRVCEGGKSYGRLTMRDVLRSDTTDRYPSTAQKEKSQERVENGSESVEKPEYYHVDYSIYAPRKLLSKTSSFYQSFSIK